MYFWYDEGTFLIILGEMNSYFFLKFKFDERKVLVFFYQYRINLCTKKWATLNTCKHVLSFFLKKKKNTLKIKMIKIVSRTFFHICRIMFLKK